MATNVKYSAKLIDTNNHDNDLVEDFDGVILLSPNGHKWQATIDNTGVVTWTDIG